MMGKNYYNRKEESMTSKSHEENDTKVSGYMLLLL
jgi:hypothetical protein